jgi:hypothetical protein
MCWYDYSVFAGNCKKNLMQFKVYIWKSTVGGCNCAAVIGYEQPKEA